jgi:hypothetical protein
VKIAVARLARRELRSRRSGQIDEGTPQMLKRTIGRLAAGSVIAAAGLLSVCGVANAAPAQHTIASPTASAAAVDCGSIDTPDGAGRFEVIADYTRAGLVRCVDAFNVTDEYLREAPTRGEGTAHVLNVHGWTCMADTGAYGTGRIGCAKDGLAFHADPIA